MKQLLILSGLLVSGTVLAQVNTTYGQQAAPIVTGNYNSAFGYSPLLNTTSGYGNTAVGGMAGYGNSTGFLNVYIGFESGYSVIGTGNNNILISNLGLAKDNNVIRIGTQGTQKFTQIAGIFESKIVGGRAVVVDGKGHLGYASTVTVPNSSSAPAYQSDVATLQQQLTALQQEVADLKAKLGIP